LHNGAVGEAPALVGAARARCIPCVAVAQL